MSLRLGIDASNIRAGGGLTHLVELLRAADPLAHGFSAVTVWGGASTLAALPRAAWLTAVHEPLLDRALPLRVWWSATRLTPSARERCDVLFVPGGRYSGSFQPFVTISQNLLPFDSAASRLGGRPERIGRMALLRQLQSSTFRRASGVIFLTQTARQTVLESMGGNALALSAVIPHGIAPAFRRAPAAQLDFSSFSAERPFRWLYVSIIDYYKHQAEIARAATALRFKGLPIAVDFVGPGYAPALRRFRETLRACDPDGLFLRYAGPVSHAQLPLLYHAADGFVFASSCENLPNILLEAMASRLPIACSSRSVMPEVGRDSVEYFDPYDAMSVSKALGRVMRDRRRRQQLADSAATAAGEYSWKRCAHETFQFLSRATTSTAHT